MSSVLARTTFAALLLFASAAEAQFVAVGDVAGVPGERVEVAVRWAPESSEATALSVLLGFDAEAPFVSRSDGTPQCEIDPAVMKDASDFRFRPAECVLGDSCDSLRATLISFDPSQNSVPIPDGVIFSCAFVIPEAAQPGDQFRVSVVEAVAARPDGTEVDIAAASSGGVIRVRGAVPCNGDADGDGEISLGEVQEVFNSFLEGCPEGK